MKKLEVGRDLFHRVGEEGPEPSCFRYLSEWRLSRGPARATLLGGC